MGDWGDWKDDVAGSESLFYSGLCVDPAKMYLFKGESDTALEVKTMAAPDRWG